MANQKQQSRPNSRETILAAVRRTVLPDSGLPSLDHSWIKYPDPVAQFSTVLHSVGAQCFQLPSAPAANDQLLQLPVYQQAQQIVSRVPEVGKSTFDLSVVNDPHDLEKLDFAILPGEFGVAENGAIWVTDRDLTWPVQYFIVQHLALEVSKREVVDNMHQAYERLQFKWPQYGCFIAGPSKTADIEQSLVIGAHGPRSLTVFCLD